MSYQDKIIPVYETPVQYLEGAGTNGNRIFIKRDDLLSFALGGNKVRIAACLIEYMKKRGCDALIMYGDLGSNLCRVLANYCAMSGLPAIMVASGAQGKKAAPAGGKDSLSAEEEASFNERLVRRFQVPVLECESGRIAEAVDEAFGRLQAQGYRPYYVYGDRTGSGNEGVLALAYERAAAEILEWQKQEDVWFDRIVLPCGTGGTLGGLTAGTLLLRKQYEQAGHRMPDVVGISISSRSRERACSILKQTVLECFRLLEAEPPEDLEEHLLLETGYNCGGYGERSDQVDAVIERMLAGWSLPLDPVYTGKAYCGMEQYLSDRQISRETILFLHTGGLPIFFDYLKKRSSLC